MNPNNGLKYKIIFANIGFSIGCFLIAIVIYAVPTVKNYALIAGWPIPLMLAYIWFHLAEKKSNDEGG